MCKYIYLSKCILNTYLSLSISIYLYLSLYLPISKLSLTLTLTLILTDPSPPPPPYIYISLKFQGQGIPRLRNSSRSKRHDNRMQCVILFLIPDQQKIAIRSLLDQLKELGIYGLWTKWYCINIKFPDFITALCWYKRMSSFLEIYYEINK